MQNILQNEVDKNAKLQTIIQQLNKDLETAEKEKRHLIAEIENLSSVCDKLVKGKGPNLLHPDTLLL